MPLDTDDSPCMRGRPTCSYPGAMWSHLVGEQREAHVRALLDALDLTTESGPTAVLLTSPAGWGKTRLVHEFYERIASPQSQKYWPPEITSKSDDVGILQRRKVTHPGTFTVQTNSYPEWMWWGLLAPTRRRDAFPSNSYGRHSVVQPRCGATIPHSTCASACKGNCTSTQPNSHHWKRSGVLHPRLRYRISCSSRRDRALARWETMDGASENWPITCRQS